MKVLLPVFLLFAACSTCTTPQAMGKYAVFSKVQGTSMEPAIMPGDTLLVDPTFPFDQVHPGMPVERDLGGMLICHRVIGWRSGLRTKGDNNAEPDLGWLTPCNYRGAIVAIFSPGNGMSFPK